MHKKIRKGIVILLWLVIWQFAAVCIDNVILLVGPVQVFYAFMQNMLQPDFMKIVFYSFARIGLGFFLALFLGLFLGAAGYRFPIVAEILEPVIQTMKAVPVASFVVLLLIWFGSGKLSFLISLFIVFPNVYVNTMAGLKSTDVKLLEMSRVFGVSRWNRFFYIYRPALMPYLNSCLKISLGMSWKSGAAAEVIGLPDYSLGERLYMSKIYLDTAGLLAWTMTIILISYGFEKAVLWLLGMYSAWKPYPIFRFGAGRCQSVKKGQMHSRRMEKNQEECEAGEQVAAAVSHISKSYGTLHVLRDYSLTIREKDRYLLMAPSGSGKTTLLRILTGLEYADQGQTVEIPAPVGMVFQEDRLCEEYDAVCNIMLGMGQTIVDGGQDGTDRRWQSAGKKRERTAEFVIEEASLILPEDCLTKPVKELSGGMRRRVSLLRAVLSDSDFLILDEPFSGLDEENRIRCGAYLMNNLRGRTLLATTHRAEDAGLLQGEIKII